MAKCESCDGLESSLFPDKGDGVCGTCHGDGRGSSYHQWVESLAGMDEEDQADCTECGGDGQCKECGGTGEV